jgi:hypothetical protein
MAILDQLIEKKDIKAYINFRIKRLLVVKASIVNKTSANYANIKPRKRQTAIKQIKGRILELKQLRKAVNVGIKETSKKECVGYWGQLKTEYPEKYKELTEKNNQA